VRTRKKGGGSYSGTLSLCEQVAQAAAAIATLHGAKLRPAAAGAGKKGGKKAGKKGSKKGGGAAEGGQVQAFVDHLRI